MRKLLLSFQAFWLADASFVVLLVMLVAVVFVLPVLMELTSYGVLLFNVLLLGVFLSGIFSTRNPWLIGIAATLFCVQLVLRLIRFGDNPFSFYLLENVVGIANALFFILINLRLLFRDQSVNSYRIVGAVNIYLLLALVGALAMEIIQGATGASLGGNVTLKGTDSDFPQLIYFSLVTLTTVGFGDVYAVTTPARMLTTFLSMLGVLFPAVVIARLVGQVSASK